MLKEIQTFLPCWPLFPIFDGSYSSQLRYILILITIHENITMHLAVMSPYLPPVWHYSSVFFFSNLDFWKECCQLFWRMSLSLSFLDAFLWIGWGYAFLTKSHIEMMLCPSQRFILGRPKLHVSLLAMLILITVVMVLSPWFLWW